MREFWAIARLTVLECLRSRFVVVLALVLCVCLLSLATGTKGDGTLKGQIQAFLDYSTSLMQVLIGLLTIVLAAFVTSTDIQAKTIFTTATKPVWRPTYVAGRWFGVVLVSASLLAGSMAAIYGLAHYLRQRPTEVEQQKALGKLPPWEGDYDRFGVENEIFSPRVEVSPDPLPIREAAVRQVRKLLDSLGRERVIRQYARIKLTEEAKSTNTPLPTAEQIEEFATDPKCRDRVLNELLNQETERIGKNALVVRRGGSFYMVFSDVRIAEGGVLQLRYKLHADTGAGTMPESGVLKSTWVFRNLKQDLSWGEPRDDGLDTTSTIEIPWQMVTPDHRLYVEYVNRWENNASVVIDLKEMKLRYSAGRFGANLARAGLIVLIRLVFLAAFGVMLGTFLSFPVACMVCVAVLLAGVMGDFVLGATKMGHFTGREVADYISWAVVRGIYFLLPTLPVIKSPAGPLRNGLLIPWGEIGREALTGTGMRAMLCLVLGSLLFWRKELARVQV